MESYTSDYPIFYKYNNKIETLPMKANPSFSLVNLTLLSASSQNIHHVPRQHKGPRSFAWGPSGTRVHTHFSRYRQSSPLCIVGMRHTAELELELGVYELCMAGIQLWHGVAGTVLTRDQIPWTFVCEVRWALTGEI